METKCCDNRDCGFCDTWSETGCMADLSTWEDCDQFIAEEEEEEA